MPKGGKFLTCQFQRHLTRIAAAPRGQRCPYACGSASHDHDIEAEVVESAADEGCAWARMASANSNKTQESFFILTY